jgi:hypothetical protein
MQERLESHHVAGKNNSDITVSLCVPCHNEITRHQDVWDIRWTNQNNPEGLRDAFILQGIRELLLLKYVKTYDYTYYCLADSLCYCIGQYLVSP